MVFECVFDGFGSPLGKQKQAFRSGGVAKISFSVSCILTSFKDRFGMHFWSIWYSLGEEKMSISCGRGCKNQLLRKLNVDIVFRAVLGGFGRPS